MDMGAFATAEKADKGVELTLRHPTTGVMLFDEKTKAPVGITLAGKDSRTCRSATARAATARAKSAVAIGAGRISAEQYQADAMDVAIACTLSWRNIQLGGEELSCTPENIRKLYETVPAVYEQVERFIEDRAAYLGNA